MIGLLPVQLPIPKTIGRNKTLTLEQKKLLNGQSSIGQCKSYLYPIGFNLRLVFEYYTR